MNEWQLLNDLRRPGGRLVYGRERGYYLAPAGRWVDGADVSALLTAGLIERSGEMAGVYRLSAAGLARWADTPPQSIHGQCDGCGRVRDVQPVLREEGDSAFLCEGCRLYGVEPAVQSLPADEEKARAAAVERSWTCRGCGAVTFRLTLTAEGVLCPACMRAAILRRADERRDALMEV